MQKNWLESALGQQLTIHESMLFEAAVADVFGFHALQFGGNDTNFLANSRIAHKLYADASQGNVRCLSEALPFDESSIDLYLMPHVLEFSEDPHQSLREAARVLVPEGCLIVSGFNPMSFWGMRKFFFRGETDPWSRQFISHIRLKDWLKLLGFELVHCEFCCYCPPINQLRWLNRFSFMDKIGKRWWPMLGGVYFVVAKKRVAGMTLLKPHWKKNNIVKNLMPKPAPKMDQ